MRLNQPYFATITRARTFLRQRAIAKQKHHDSSFAFNYSD